MSAEFGHRGHHNALAARAVPRALLAAPFPLSIKYAYVLPWYLCFPLPTGESREAAITPKMLGGWAANNDFKDALQS